MTSQLLITLLITPILGFIVCLLMPTRRERIVFAAAITTMILELLLLVILSVQWIGAGAAPLSATAGTLFSSEHYTFAINFYFDRLSAVFFGMATIMTTLVFVFSKYYLHREQGFKRFYYTVLLFFTGLALITLAGNFEVLLVGWELIGISSVLLIAFYRDRFLPARNALKVFSVYRIADAFLIAAIWYAHHIFASGVEFANISSLVTEHGNQIVILGVLLLIVAMIKSAQFPFSYWLPRAMEGPTTSSAIFYGAISVHMGLFLLLRTYPLWEGSVGLRIAIAVLGLVTALVASSITRVQSTIKTQIAYASITQIGIMFIEVAAGLPWLALIHFVSNASLRTYQLLISPSSVGYLVHDQFFYFVPPEHKINNSLLGRIRATLYILSIKEWDMNTAATHYLWRPLKSIGRAFAGFDSRVVQLVAAILCVICAGVITKITLTNGSLLILSISAAIISIIFYISAYATKSSAITGWNLIALGHLFGALFLGIASGESWNYLAMYGVGVIAAYVIGYGCLRYLRVKGEATELRNYHGAIYIFQKLGQLFFVICLLFMAFPISPSFLAQDIMLSAIPREYAIQIVFFCFAYLIAGVSIMRLYTKTFYGSHKSSYHEVAYKSS